jgi:hypothetical protein
MRKKGTFIKIAINKEKYRSVSNIAQTPAAHSNNTNALRKIVYIYIQRYVEFSARYC